ncbi:hypothetical protein QN222_25805 [Sinorhizobium sp. 6-70]|uniref:tetratricopeptide repeat protein n=2 Tax=unclassified Sinorhizobium TaxID=2613772 RepID=UPI0024C2CA6C|nr:hypothetical protein [Sinorhizobium sp. 6-70]MDK1377898.1 hypothetical protein [Sinorhizobium sp. 6-70]
MDAGEDSEHVAQCRVAESDVRVETERLLDDARFHATERHRKLLKYLVDEFLAGRSATVKAYSIAVDVFGRPSSFDPNVDPIVRVEVSRLRAALARYYETVGQQAPLRIELPRGNYRPQFIALSEAPEPSQPGDAPPFGSETRDEAQQTPAQQSRIVRRGLFAACAGLTVAALAAVYGMATGHLGWPPARSVKPTIIVDVRGEPAAAPAVYRLEESLVHALSQFSTVRTFTQPRQADVDTAAITGDISTVHPLLPKSNAYRLSVTHGDAAGPGGVSWQVIDMRTNETLRSGVAEAGNGHSDAAGAHQDLVVKLARTVAGDQGIVTSLEAARQLTNPSLGYGCVLLADIALARADSESMLAAQSCLERSLTYQENDAEVLASLATVLVAGAMGNSSVVTERALKLADRATALAPQSSQSYAAQMMVRFAAGETEAAFLSGRRAASLSPLDDSVLARLGYLLFVSGQWQEGVKLARSAGQNNEYVQRAAVLTLALEDYRNGNYGEALRRARQLASPSDITVSILRIAAAGQLGLQEEATNAMEELRSHVERFEPVLRRQMWAQHFSPELVRRIEAGLRKAGIRLSSGS